MRINPLIYWVERPTGFTTPIFPEGFPFLRVRCLPHLSNEAPPWGRHFLLFMATPNFIYKFNAWFCDLKYVESEAMTLACRWKARWHNKVVADQMETGFSSSAGFPSCYYEVRVPPNQSASSNWTRAFFYSILDPVQLTDFTPTCDQIDIKWDILLVGRLN